MTKNTKILIGAVIAGIIAIGGIIGNIFFFKDDPDPVINETGCYFVIDKLHKDNLYDKLIERIKKEPVERKVRFKCDLDTVLTIHGFGYQYTDKNCIVMKKDEYIDYRKDIFDKIGSKKNFLLTYEELKKTQQEFADIWNYHLFQFCKSNE